MVTAQARKLQETDPRPVLVIDARAQPRWSPIWDNNPRILRRRRGSFQTLRNGPNARPYILNKTATHWIWRDFYPEPGEIYLSEAEKSFAEEWRGSVVIEPNTKSKPEAINKTWPWRRWQDLADRRLARVIQLGPLGISKLHGVTHARTDTFRLACAVLSVCRAYVGAEGGLHHAAAALGVPAVVLFGGFISPASTGYAMHRNLYVGGAACGARLPCRHCEEAMSAISVDEVARNLKEILR
jgi:ADP-heptose:LPS heptosyltransferase